MKKEMKKIALVLAAGIFAFSAAFGVGEEGRGVLRNFDEIKIINDMTGAKLQLQLNNGKIEEITGTKKIPLKNTPTLLQQLRFSIKRGGLILGDTKQLDLARFNEQQVLEILKDGLRHMIEQARRKDNKLQVSASVNAEGKTLEIRIEQEGRMGISEGEQSSPAGSAY